MENIRNFCIIAHIDHGKSTLADRMMELTGTVAKREMKAQLLDSMDLERERGITIKLTPVTMKWSSGATQNGAKQANENDIYELNLIDTPGHVDFSYEVSRSLAAVEGAVLVVDATQGIQAQTLQNLYLAMDQDLAIIPVINKIDLPAADVPKVSREIINLLGCDEGDIIKISAKTGENVEQVLDAVVREIPAPKSPELEKYRIARRPEASAEESLATVIPTAVEGSLQIPLRALIFDSYYDEFRGVILYVRIVDGSLSKGDQIYMMATKTKGLALEIGKLTPKMTEFLKLNTGEIGYIVTNLKSTREAKVGDTVSLAKYFAN